MPFNVDQIADTSRVQLQRLFQTYDFPAFVKKADINRVMAPRSIPDHVFADLPRKQFPCDDAASTYLSALYYQEKRADFHPKDQLHIDKRIDEFAKYWRIEAAVKSAREKWADRNKQSDAQLPDTSFGDIWVGSDGRKERNLRMTTAMETKAAAEHLGKHRDAYTYERRQKIAKRILEKVAQFGAGVADEREFLERQAGLGVGSPTEIVEMIRGRSLLLANNKNLAEHYEKMAKTVEGDPQRYLHPHNLVKLATLLDTLDRDNHFVRRYADGLPRPEDVIFSATFTKAAGVIAQHVPMQSGNYYEKAAFRRLPLADVKALFGDDFANEVVTPLGEIDPEKMAAIAQTLPRAEAEQLDGLFSENGVAPVMRKAASVRQGLSDADMAAFADNYRRPVSRAG